MSDDLISRQSVIDVLATMQGRCTSKAALIQNSKIWQQIKDLPSAQAEPKTGKWVTYIISMVDGEGCRCSECGFEGVPYWNFCPNCGADMRGEDDV